MQHKAFIFKLCTRPMTVQDAVRIRYYLKTCAINAIFRACDDTNLSYERVLLNCEPLMHPLLLNYEQDTVYEQLQNIAGFLSDPIERLVTGAALQMDARTVLNIGLAVYDHDQVLLSHEVYHR